MTELIMPTTNPSCMLISRLIFHQFQPPECWFWNEKLTGMKLPNVFRNEVDKGWSNAATAFLLFIVSNYLNWYMLDVAITFFSSSFQVKLWISFGKLFTKQWVSSSMVSISCNFIPKKTFMLFWSQQYKLKIVEQMYTVRTKISRQ